MDELNIKFIYKGEESFFNFLEYIKYDLESNRFDKHYWSGDIKIGNKIFKEKEKDFANILFKIFFTLKDKDNIPIRKNTISQLQEMRRDIYSNLYDKYLSNDTERKKPLFPTRIHTNLLIPQMKIFKIL